MGGWGRERGGCAAAVLRDQAGLGRACMVQARTWVQLASGSAVAPSWCRPGWAYVRGRPASHPPMAMLCNFKCQPRPASPCCSG